MIVTKYKEPTNTHGGRIVASDEHGTKSIPYPHELHVEAAHAECARHLFREGLEYVAIETPDQKGFSFVPTRMIETSVRYSK